MKYVIFGGGGFIGSCLADRLLEEGHEIKIFEHPNAKPHRNFDDGEKVTWVGGDFLKKSDVSDVIKGTDGVFHLISTTQPQSSNDDPIFDVQSNVIGTLQLLDAMVEHNVRQIVFSSSGGTVYGDPQYVPIDERHSTNPTVSYGITKLTIEKYLQMYQNLYGIDVCILRVTNPYGKRQKLVGSQGAVGVFLNLALKGKSLEIWGDGSVVRDFIYIDDVIDACVKAIAYNGPKTVFNISSGSGTSLKELVRALESALGHPIRVDYKPGRPYDVPINTLSNDLAETELGWAPQFSMHQGLALTVNWLKNEGLQL